MEAEEEEEDGACAAAAVMIMLVVGVSCCAVSQVLARCAEFFIEHGQNDKAVGLFILGKKYSQVGTDAKGQEGRQGPCRH